MYTCRAKLYNFVKASDSEKKEWKERGLGALRLNVAMPDDQDDDDDQDEDQDEEDEAGDRPTTTTSATTVPRARLVMRADGSHRVILNTPIKKEIKFGSVSGTAPQGGYVYFMGNIDGSGKLELLQLKVSMICQRS